MITLTHDIVDAVSLKEHQRLINKADHKRLFLAPAGQEHYKLLRYLASQVDTDIVELGTHAGTGSLALALGTKKIVHTFNVRDQFTSYPLKNIKRYIGEIFQLGLAELMLQCDLVFLDTAHNGPFEKKVYTYLVEQRYKGILLLDDIFYNDSMHKFWKGISTLKYNITYLGHGFRNCGTGIVDFGNNLHRPRTCPRRMREPGPWSREEHLDSWRADRWASGRWPQGYSQPKSCSFCGGVYPDDAISLVRKGWEVDPTDKWYKRYLQPPGYRQQVKRTLQRIRGIPVPDMSITLPTPPVKLYVQHFSEDQMETFNKAIKSESQ